MVKLFSKTLLLFVLVGSNSIANAQSISLTSGIKLPDSSLIKTSLLPALNGFIIELERPYKENQYVDQSVLPETSALMDELKNMDKNEKTHEKAFYKCTLNNAVKIDEGKYLIQISYLGINDGYPVLKASFRLIAIKNGDSYIFKSPLKENTLNWKSKTIDNLTYFYKTESNTANAKQYQKTVALYDKKLGANSLPIDFYYCDNFTEAQRILGIDYKADYVGMKYNNFTSFENGHNLMVNGWNDSTHRFDPHDLWHERLSNVMKSAIINRPVDEGCAYLYGGSWGFTWPQVLEKFKIYLQKNPNPNWLVLYTENKNFEDGPKVMKISYMLNALLVNKIEKEKGFAPVLQLLACGPREKGDENYFNTLQKIAGIKKEDFNKIVNELVSQL